jgi:hypothetical protein
LIPGGGKAKGSSWEREVGVSLSLWLTQGARADLFSRNVGSGSRFTLAVSKDRERSQAGDLMAAHPLAIDFLDRFIIEGKFYKDLALVPFLCFRDACFLNQVVAKANKEAQIDAKHALIVAKQNRLPAFLLTTKEVGNVIIASTWTPRAGLPLRLEYHFMNNSEVFVCKFQDLLSHVKPEQLLKALR